jgi:hypothetical protein
LLYGNGTSALSTTTQGTAGQVLAFLGGIPTWTATTTFSSGLQYANGTVTNTGLLSLTQNGGGSAQTGAITFATSSASFNGLTLGHTITNAGATFTFTPTLTGTLNNAGLTNSAIGAASPNSTLTFGAAAALGSTFTGDINLAHANSWTGLQQFANASTSLFSAYGPAYFGSTATSTFGTDGSLTLANALGTASGGTGATTTAKARQNLGVYTSQIVGKDLEPATHLSNLIGKTSATVCIIGDSTMTAGPTLGNNVDPSQIVWGMLQDELKAKNPQITSWNFQNFAIGGANENHPQLTGTATGLSLPSWFTDPAQTWLSYVQTASCDVLFWGFGTNAATSGETSGTGAASFIRQDFEIINGWTKVPNIIIITNKNANPTTDTGAGDDANESAHKAQAAFHRTFARTDASGYTTFSKITALGIGLLDLGRSFTERVDGYDPAVQYLQSKPSCIVTGKALGTGARVGTDSTTTMCTTTHGDYRMTFTLPASGGTTLSGYGGGNAIFVGGGPWTSNYIRLAIGGGGNIVPRYVLDGSIGAAPSQVGTSVATINGADVTITVSMINERVQVTINGTLALDIIAPRFVSGTTGGTPINVGFSTAPTGSPTINVTEFYEGIGSPTLSTMTAQQAYGDYAVASCTSSVTGCQGGNTINHQTSYSAALDREIIRAMSWAVPPAYWSLSGTNLSNNSGTNIGIGTSSPQGLLDVSGSSNSTTLTTFVGARALSIINTDTTNNNASGFDFRTNDATGILTTGAKIMAVYTAHSANAVSSDLAFLTRNAGTLAERARLTAAGNVGIATTSPWRTLSVTGTVGFDGLSSVSTNQSAYLCLSATKEVVQDSTTCLASSARFKQNIAPLTASSSLSEVMALAPVSFEYTPSYNGALQSDPNFNGTFVGFIAEDVAKIDPRLITIDAVGATPNAPHGVRYENITAILAGAIKALATELSSLSTTVAGFAQSFTSDIITANKQLCVADSAGKTCITKAQLDALLAGQGTTGQGSGSSGTLAPAVSPTPSSTPDTASSTPDQPATTTPPASDTPTPDTSSQASTTPSGQAAGAASASTTTPS